MYVIAEDCLRSSWIRHQYVGVQIVLDQICGDNEEKLGKFMIINIMGFFMDLCVLAFTIHTFTLT